MTRDELTSVLSAELERIAPEINFNDADPNIDLRDAFEIDSMDFQNLVTALHARLEVPIPEKDYDQLQSIDGILNYLMTQMRNTA